MFIEQQELWLSLCMFLISRRNILKVTNPIITFLSGGTGHQEAKKNKFWDAVGAVFWVVQEGGEEGGQRWFENR